MTLHDLCARLLPPDDHLLVETLLMEEHGISLLETNSVSSRRTWWVSITSSPASCSGASIRRTSAVA